MTDSLQEMRYRYGGRVAHIVAPVHDRPQILISRCGLALYTSVWRGTENRYQVAKVAALPLCKSCKKASQS